ncbi:MAG: alpha-isopropylmalate synthase regulatory domain-containing protein [Nanoarchaeota archaeon]|nr:alpha-isopropylmalate synthase regulatory domain-containing protein [Nanoarchaeota archaeon]
MLEIYDCTLREGEQAGGVHFSIDERIEIARKLYEAEVDFIEFGWPIQEEVLEAFLKLDEKIKEKIVAFGSTSIAEDPEQDANLDSIAKSKVKYACIFGKTWLEHVQKQLNISEQENLDKIKKSVEFLRSKGMDVFYDAEHYFDGFKHNSEYALKTLESAISGGASRIILCDTNGGSLPEEIKEILEKTKKFLGDNNLNIKLGVHFHNDSALSLTNSLCALNFVEQVQGTINGIGERVGNLDLCEFIPLLVLKKGYYLGAKLEKLKELSDLVYLTANLPNKINQAFVSQRAFSHKGGVHIDATSKGASYSHISPERLGLVYNLTLTSLGGAACVVETASKFGYNLDKKDAKTKEKITEVLRYLKENEKRGYDAGNIEAEQFIIISKFFGNFKEVFKIKKWEVVTNGNKSSCYLKFDLGEEIEIKEEVEGGPVESIYKALIEILSPKYEKIRNLKLKNYKVRIAHGKGAGSEVRTRIDFSDGEKFSTVGVSENIIKSSLEALEKAFNFYLNKINL